MDKKADILKIAATIIKDGKLLIVKPTGKDYWKNPGGGIEEGENEIECIKRELREEFNIGIIGIPKFLTETPATPALGDPGKTVQIKFYLTEIDGEITRENLFSEEIEDFHWLGKDDVDTYNISSQIKNYLIPHILGKGLIK